MPLFLFNNHWRTWNRVLLNDLNGASVELGLTHVNGSRLHVEQQVIRLHSVPRTPKDIFTDALPLQVQESIVHTLGRHMFDRLTTFDYLPTIDWQLYKKHADVGRHGGAPYVKITRYLDLKGPK